MHVITLPTRKCKEGAPSTVLKVLTYTRFLMARAANLVGKRTIRIVTKYDAL